MQDGGQPEHVEAQVETEILDAVAAGSFAVTRNVFLFGWNTCRSQIGPDQAGRDAGRHAVHHQVIGEVCERMPQGRKLPVQHRQHARLAGMKNHVVAAKVAVNDGGFIARRDM